MAPYINYNLIEAEDNRKKQTIAFLVFILNIMFPFSLGTFVFVCCYPNRENKDSIHAWCHIGFTILTYVMLIVFIATVNNSNNSDVPATLIIFFLFFTITYLWGLVFAGIIIYKVRSVFNSMRMPISLTTNIHHVNVSQYQPLPQ